MDPSSSKNVNLPPNINLDLTLGPASNNDVENPNTPSSVCSNAEVNANDYSLNPVPPPALDPSNVNLDLTLGPASINDVENPNAPFSVGYKAEVNANDYSPNPVPAYVNLPLVDTKRQREEEKRVIDKWIDRHINEDVDLDHVNDKLAETYEQPSDLRIVLRRYQKEFLAWALKQEKSDVKGGILADEKGMGKIVQAISLVIAKREIDRALSDELMGNTLVICRGIDVPHWKTEFKKITCVKVHEYQGNCTKEVFTKYYFVLATYHTLKTEYCGHSESSPLHSVKWNRIILDEVDGHGIKNRYSKTSKAVFALVATYRWALTSTPLLDNLKNLGSMIWFLRIDPYGSYRCDECECKPADHIAKRIWCPTCGHFGGSHIYWWTKYVMDPIRDDEDSNNRKRGKILLKHKVLKGILIRRTKRGREADLAAH